MKNDLLHRLPPPPIFTIRPPPKPPGALFENFQTVKILNDRCVLPSLNFFNISSSSATVLRKHDDTINWLNVFLIIMAVISVIFCIIIAIFIFICLKKLRNEEKQYKSCGMSASVTSRNYRQQYYIDACTRTNEHYKCTSNTFNYCDDYYSHQLIPMKNDSHCMENSNKILQFSTMENIIDDQDTSQIHQYECIPEYMLTMARHHHRPALVCQHTHQLCHQTDNTCNIPYASFSRSYLIPQPIITTSTSDSSQCTCSSPPSIIVHQEESSTPLLPSITLKGSTNTRDTSPSKIETVRWTRTNLSSAKKQASTEEQYTRASQLRKSSIL